MASTVPCFPSGTKACLSWPFGSSQAGEGDGCVGGRAMGDVAWRLIDTVQEINSSKVRLR